MAFVANAFSLGRVDCEGGGQQPLAMEIEALLAPVAGMSIVVVK